MSRDGRNHSHTNSPVGGPFNRWTLSATAVTDPARQTGRHLIFGAGAGNHEQVMRGEIDRYAVNRCRPYRAGMCVD